jgi:polygalacturonase
MEHSILCSTWAFMFIALVSVNLVSALPSDPQAISPCFVTEHTAIASAVKASCKAITLSDVFTPGNFSIELTNLEPGTTVTFQGRITFGFTNSSSFTPLIISNSSDVTITGAPGSVIDGNGSVYWDGIGSNGGVPKPNTFIKLKKLTGNTVVKNLRIVNWPTHCFSIEGCEDLTIRNLTLDNRAGDAPNDRSDGKPAAHNTDGFGIKSSKRVLVSDSLVWNQDDCVAITSGDDIVARNMFCSGGHGLSIGSVGGKDDNNVTNIVFANSTVLNSENGARIKTNFNTTGYVGNVRYSGITVINATKRGIDLQQDYLNGGPTGEPSNGVRVEGVVFENIIGTAGKEAMDYYVLCGDGSCKDVEFRGVSISGGGKESSCNFPADGCPKNTLP